MPEYPPVPQHLRTDVGFSIGGSTPTHIRQFWAFTGSAPSSATALAIAQHLRGLYVTNVVPLMPTNWSLTNVTCTDLSTTSGAVGVATGGTFGSRPGEQNSANDAVVVHFLISRRYRGGKPRNYIPMGVAGDQTQSRNWTTAFITTATTAMNAIQTGMKGFASGGVTISTQTNVSYYKGFTTYNGSGGRPKVRNTLRATPVTDTITGLVVDTRIGSQRRRLNQ